MRVLSHFSRVWLFATLWTVAHQAPLSMGFSRQEYWSGWPCPPPGDLPDPGIFYLLHWLTTSPTCCSSAYICLGHWPNSDKHGTITWVSTSFVIPISFCPAPTKTWRVNSSFRFSRYTVYVRGFYKHMSSCQFLKKISKSDCYNTGLFLLSKSLKEEKHCWLE